MTYVLAAALLAGCGHSTRDASLRYRTLIHASAAGDEELVRALLDKGAPVNLEDPNADDLAYVSAHMNTPLQSAAEHGHTEIVRLLIARGAWLDAQCCDSHTPLGFAARGGHHETVVLLLAAGADPLRSSHEGTPLEVARKYGHQGIVDVLQSRVAPPN